MKTRIILISLVLLLTGGFSTELFAQDNIKALMQQIEKMDDKEILEADIVRKNNPTLRTKSFTMLAKLKYSPELEKKLIDTFQKDSEKANQVIEQKKEGKVQQYLYRFDNATYSFTINNDTISIQAKESIPLIRLR
jgi:hypothetical protein